MRRLSLPVLCAVLALGGAGSAHAFWGAAGFGSGSGAAATMPAGATPTATASSQSVTVTWAQSTFLGSRLGTFGGGGYAVTRYAPGNATPLTPSASCTTPVTGTTATVQCVETGVPYGSWRYSVTPVLNTFTGAEGALSPAVDVTTAAPVLGSVTAQNPTVGQTTGDLQVTWAATAGATGYNVFRRTTGAYDFDSPLNGATPVTSTSYTDPGSGLGPSTSYAYVVRALAATPAVASASSNELGGTSITRPAAPGGSVTATAAAAAEVTVSWSSVPGAVGYNVFRRTAAGAFDFTAPLNGSTPSAATTYTDTTSTNGTTYVYAVRTVVTGAGGAQVQSATSAESNAATADGSAPPAPTSTGVTGGGPVWGTTACAVTAGTRYVNAAGQGVVGVTTTIATPESGQSVVFSATTPGSTPVTATVAAAGTTVTTTLNLASLADGTVTLTARTKDVAGNLSATVAPVNLIVKDVVAAALTGVAYNDRALVADQITGTSECGAAITALQTAPGSSTYTLSPVGASGAFTLNVAAQALGSYSYSVTAADRAGNPSAAVVVSGFALL